MLTVVNVVTNHCITVAPRCLHAALDNCKVGYYNRAAQSQESLHMLRTPPMKAHDVFFASDEHLYRQTPRVVVLPPPLQIPQILIEDISEIEHKIIPKSTSLDHASSLLRIEPFSKSLQDLSTSNSTISSVAYTSQVDLSNPDANEKFWKSPKTSNAAKLPSEFSLVSSYPQLSKQNELDEQVKKCRSQEVIGNKLNKYERLEILKMLCDMNLDYGYDDYSYEQGTADMSAKDKYIYYSLPNLDNLEHLIDVGNATPSTLDETSSKYFSEDVLSSSNRKIEDDFMHHCKFTNCIFNYDYCDQIERPNTIDSTNLDTIGTNLVQEDDTLDKYVSNTTTTITNNVNAPMSNENVTNNSIQVNVVKKLGKRRSSLRNIKKHKQYQTIDRSHSYEDNSTADQRYTESWNNNNNNVHSASTVVDNNNEPNDRRIKAVRKCCCLATSTCPILAKYYLDQLNNGRTWGQAQNGGQRADDRIQICEDNIYVEHM